MLKFSRLAVVSVVAGAMFAVPIGSAVAMHVSSESTSLSDREMKHQKVTRSSSQEALSSHEDVQAGRDGSSTEDDASQGDGVGSESQRDLGAGVGYGSDVVGSGGGKSPTDGFGSTGSSGVSDGQANEASGTANDKSDNSSASSKATSCVGSGAVQDVVYKVNGTTVPKLRGNAREGATVNVEFEVRQGCDDVAIGLAAYRAPSSKWVASEAKQQVLADKMAGVYSADGATKTLEVTLDSCYFQVDFFTGVPVDSLDERGGYFDGNMIAADNGGTKPCTTTPAPPVETDDCPEADSAKITRYSYTIGDKSGLSTMAGNVKPGDTVTVDFVIAKGCEDQQLSLVSYEAPSAVYSDATADKQVLFDSDSGAFSAGAHSLTVDVPDCYFQVDFVRGPAIKKLGPTGTDNFYSRQGRLIEAVTGGVACTVTTLPPVAPTTSTTATPRPVQPQTEVLGVTITAPPRVAPAQVAQAQLAKTGFETTPLIGLGVGLIAIGAVLQGAAIRVRKQRSARPLV